LRGILKWPGPSKRRPDSPHRSGEDYEPPAVLKHGTSRISDDWTGCPTRWRDRSVVISPYGRKEKGPKEGSSFRQSARTDARRLERYSPVKKSHDGTGRQPEKRGQSADRYGEIRWFQFASPTQWTSLLSELPILAGGGGGGGLASLGPVTDC